jgi:hypothetical protein
MSSFSNVIEEVKSFNYDELQELNFITTKYLDEFERNRLFQSHKDSIYEYNQGNLKFSSDINQLKMMLEVR